MQEQVNEIIHLDRRTVSPEAASFSLILLPLQYRHIVAS